MSKTSSTKRHGTYFFLLAAMFGALGLTAQTLSERFPLPTSAMVAQAQESIEMEENMVQPEPEQDPDLYHYIEIISGCSPLLGDDCVQAHAGPGEEYTSVAPLRKGTVLKVTEMIYKNDRVWFHVEFDEWLRYPKRVAKEWYIAADNVRLFKDEGILELTDGKVDEINKLIRINRSEQMLYAYEGDELFLQQSISTGLLQTPTPRGTFFIFKKTPTRYMQGPLPGISSKYYDLPGVPWNLYFTQQGAVIHGAYWHNQFGKQWSNGCVNVPTAQSEKLYAWADIGTPVIVQD